MTIAAKTEAHGHQHRDVSGGWLRPAVFGPMDALVTNVSLIAGVGGGGGQRSALVLTGLAGRAAAALSMATREHVPPDSQNALLHAQVADEPHQLLHNPPAKRR